MGLHVFREWYRIYLVNHYEFAGSIKICFSQMKDKVCCIIVEKKRRSEDYEYR